jgi:NDP-sugar pyrophosphorylase family protein
MKAMILAAGLGTRLKPLTDSMPKALVVVNGKTLLEHSVNHLVQYGGDEIIINVHHFAEQILEFLEKKNNFGLRIEISDESKMLLDTGGGLKKAAYFFDDGNPFLLRNVDVISNLDLDAMMSFHLKSGSLATLAVKNRITSRYLLFDKSMRLCGWMNDKNGERICLNEQEETAKAAFSGIHVLDPGIFPLITETGKFSLTALYLGLAREHRISGYLEDVSYWEDAGKRIPEIYM